MLCTEFTHASFLYSGQKRSLEFDFAWGKWKETEGVTTWCWVSGCRVCMLLLFIYKLWIKRAVRMCVNLSPPWTAIHCYSLLNRLAVLFLITHGKALVGGLEQKFWMPLQLCLHEKVSGLLCVPQYKIESGEMMCFQIQHYIIAENMTQLIKILGGQQFLPCIKLETLL